MQMHPSQTNTPTYNRGKTRLDYALLSNNTPAPTGMGHNPYNFIYKSDHRATFIDHPLKETLSFSQPIVSPELRVIYSDSSKVNLFINTVDSHFQCNGLYDKTNSFQSTIQTNTQPWIEANIIDTQIGLAIQHGKKKCFVPKRPPWSEKLHHASLTVRFWKTAESGTTPPIQNQQDSLDEIRNELSSLPTSIPTLPIIKENLKEAMKVLRKTRVNAVEARKEFLQELRERIATRKTHPTLTVEKALKIIDYQLRSGKNFRRIKNKLSSTTSQTLTQVQITKETAHINPTEKQYI